MPSLLPITELPVIDNPPHRSAALLDHLSRRVRSRSQAALEPIGLRPRHLIALTLLRDHGEETQQELATALEVDRTNLVGLLNDLERDGLVERRRSDADRRRHIVALTDAGAERLATAEFALAAVENEVFAALTPAQRETLYELLQQATSGHMLDCATALRSAAQSPGGC